MFIWFYFLFVRSSRSSLPAGPGDGARRGPSRSGQGGVRSGSKPVGQCAVHVAIQQLAGNGRLGQGPVHGGRSSQHGSVHATNATGLWHANVLGEQRVRQTERAVRVPSDSSR